MWHHHKQKPFANSKCLPICYRELGEKSRTSTWGDNVELSPLTTRTLNETKYSMTTSTERSLQNSNSNDRKIRNFIGLPMKFKFNSGFIGLASLLVCIFYVLVPIAMAEKQYTNQFAVQIIGGPKVADSVALRHGFINRGQIGGLKDYFLFEHHEIEKRSLDYSHKHHVALKKENEVLWVEQQHEKRRKKRDGYSDSLEMRSLPKFPDPLFTEQWYLRKGAYGGNDMNVAPVWEQGITGKGVVVTILDDGIQTNHPDLKQNYDPKASSDINGLDDDPMPQDNGDNKHGTRCAGEVAATAFNEFCGVGIAYNASIGGVRMLDGTVTDEVEARALSLNYDHIDIYSASWGPEDDGKTVDGPGRLAKSAFLEGIKNGRQGKGSIFVWASGNGGRHQDNCNCDGYTNSIYTLSISSATQAGAKPWYLEECSSTLATTYSSGTPRQDENVVTVDMDMSYIKDVQNNRNPNLAALCTNSHTGTSASAPIAAALAALALEANPRLTWRDMQHVVVLSSRPDPLNREDGWVTNGVGRKVSHKFGYGLMDASLLVKLAQQWKNVPEQRTCHTPSDKQERQISADYGDRLEVTMVTNGCQDSTDGINYLEHVQTVITLQFLPRGNLRIILVSPSGTPSSLLLPRPFDSAESSFVKWPFLSVHFWGENPNGQWKLIIVNEGRHRVSNAGVLKEWSLVFYGTEKNPVNLKANSGRRRHFTSSLEVQNPCAVEGKYQKLEDTEDCLTVCPPGYHGDDQRICRPCSSECDQCYGSGSDHCLTCPRNMYLSKTDACVSTCPSGYFADPTTRDCLPCSSSCLECKGAPDRCQVCKDKFFLYQEQCLSSCPEQTYQVDSRCNNCDPSCASCSGPREYQCLYCNSNFFYLNGTCKAECPRGYYEHYPTNACYRCGQGCESCNQGGNCLHCYESWKMDDRSNLCVLEENNCEHGYLSVDTNQCVDCHSTCKECVGSSKYACATCQDGWLLHNSQCVQACPDGYYKTLGHECNPCPQSCSLCSAFGFCTACVYGLVLQGEKCVSSCEEGWYNSESKCHECDSSCKSCHGSGPRNCTSCNVNNYLFNGGCLTSCPEGFYQSISVHGAGECIACHHACQTCQGPGPKACETCPKTSVLINKTCYPCQRNEFYDIAKKMCVPCHSSCNECFGPLESNCASCQLPSRLNRDSGMCLPCCGLRETPTDGKCCPCNDNSELCGGYSDKPRSVVSSSSSDSGVSNDAKIPFANLGNDALKIPMKSIVPVVVGICLSAVLLFFVVFGFLQSVSAGHFKRRLGGGAGGGLGNSYKRVPVGRYEGDSEKVSLTQEDEDEDEEDLFEKT